MTSSNSFSKIHDSILSVAGIDYSLSSPAIVVCDVSDGTFQWKNCESFFLTGTKKYDGVLNESCFGEQHQEYKSDIERYTNIATWAIDKMTHCDIVALEGYAMGAKGRVFNIAENTAILKFIMEDEMLPYKIVAPTELKKYATGKGNANKEAMHEAFVNETGVSLQEALTPGLDKIGNPVSDVVDAYYLAKWVWESTLG